MIKAVFDTNIYFQAAIGKNGPAEACWNLVREGVVTVFITDEILKEVAEVLRRPALRAKFASLTDARVRQILKNYHSFTVMIREVEKSFPLERDKDDEKFVDLALSTKASFLVTRDKDLLDLTFDPRFTSSYPNLKLVTPYEFLQAVRSTS